MASTATMSPRSAQMCTMHAGRQLQVSGCDVSPWNAGTKLACSWQWGENVGESGSNVRRKSRTIADHTDMMSQKAATTQYSSTLLMQGLHTLMRYTYMIACDIELTSIPLSSTALPSPPHTVERSTGRTHIDPLSTRLYVRVRSS